MYGKKTTQKNTKFPKKHKFELGLDTPTHFRVFLGFKKKNYLDKILKWDIYDDFKLKEIPLVSSVFTKIIKGQYKTDTLQHNASLTRR